MVVVVVSTPLCQFLTLFHSKGKKSKQKKKQKWSVQTDEQRDALLRELSALPCFSLPSGLPNPRLGLKNTTGCNHGCEIVTKGRVNDILFLLVTGLNFAVDGALGAVESAADLELRAVRFAERITKKARTFSFFEKIWCGGDGSDELVASLLSIGTDCLLIEGNISKEGKLKMATAITGIVQNLGPLSGKTVEAVESLRKRLDVVNGGEREIVSFFHKRIRCDCLKSKYKLLKDTKEKMGKCDGCNNFFELKQLQLCGYCQYVQVITVGYVMLLFSRNLPQTLLPSTVLFKTLSEASSTRARGAM